MLVSTVLNNYINQLGREAPKLFFDLLDSTSEQEIMAMNAAILHKKIAFIDTTILLKTIEDLEPFLQTCWRDKHYIDHEVICSLLIKLMLTFLKIRYNMTGNEKGMTFKFDSPDVRFLPAQKAFEFENELKTGLSRYYNLRGNAYLMMGENLKAIDDYDWALGIEGLTEPWVALCNRSLANTNLGRWNEAEKDLLDARRIAPRPIKAVEDLFAQLKKTKAKHNPSAERRDASNNPLLILGRYIRKVTENMFARLSKAKFKYDPLLERGNTPINSWILLGKRISLPRELEFYCNFLDTLSEREIKNYDPKQLRHAMNIDDTGALTVFAAKVNPVADKCYRSKDYIVAEIIYSLQIKLLLAFLKIQYCFLDRKDILLSMRSNHSAAEILYYISSAYFNRGNTYDRINTYEFWQKSLEDYKQAMYYGNPQPWDVHFNTGRVYQKMGNLVEARSYYLQSQQGAPRSMVARVQRALASIE